MKSSVFYPDPPHISAAFYLDNVENQAVIAIACDAVTALGATPTGDLEAVRSNEFPHFDTTADLSPLLLTLELKTARQNQREQWEQTIHGKIPDVIPLRVAFYDAKAGKIVVGYGPSSGNHNHPLEISLSGSFVSIPSTVALNRREKSEAAAVTSFINAVFRQICETHDPLYAAILVERSLPTPLDLISGQTALSTDLFISNRLLQKDNSLKIDLSKYFAEGHFEQWNSGMYFSGWDALNGQGKKVPDPLETEQRAARRLGHSLQMIPR